MPIVEINNIHNQVSIASVFLAKTSENACIFVELVPRYSLKRA